MCVGGEECVFVIEFVCACSPLPLLSPGAVPPRLKGGDCAFIGMEAEMAGGRRKRRVRVIECAAWRRKRETERRERGEGQAALCLKQGGGKGEEKERSRQAGEEVTGWR